MIKKQTQLANTKLNFLDNQCEGLLLEANMV